MSTARQILARDNLNDVSTDELLTLGRADDLTPEEARRMTEMLGEIGARFATTTEGRRCIAFAPGAEVPKRLQLSRGDVHPLLTQIDRDTLVDTLPDNDAVKAMARNYRDALAEERQLNATPEPSDPVAGIRLEQRRQRAKEDRRRHEDTLRKSLLRRRAAGKPVPDSLQLSRDFSDPHEVAQDQRVELLKKVNDARDAREKVRAEPAHDVVWSMKLEAAKKEVAAAEKEYTAALQAAVEDVPPAALQASRGDGGLSPERRRELLSASLGGLDVLAGEGADGRRQGGLSEDRRRELLSASAGGLDVLNAEAEQQGRAQGEAWKKQQLKARGISE